MQLKKVLVVGNGGREHALISKIKDSPLLGKIYTTNPEFSRFAEHIKADPTNHLYLSSICKSEEIDLVVVGQERYLENGITDALTAEGVAVFGPTKNAAKLESSKFFAKEIAEMQGTPTARYAFCSSPNNLRKQIESIGDFPVVIKANGLASGKGVVMCGTMDEALQVGEAMLNGMFGAASKNIIVEEFLQGEELSYFVLVDGQTVLPIGYARDHKQVTHQGKTYNTGGMGAYSPAPISTKVEQEILGRIIYPTISALSSINIRYKGVLFAGLMLTNSGPKLLEYNVRFGDPETQAILSRLEGDLLDLMFKTVGGELDRASISFSDDVSLSVVLATQGYPVDYKTGYHINGDNLERAINAVDGLQIFNAGIKYDENGNMLSNGGRVLNLVVKGSSLNDCKRKAKQAIDIIDWKEGFCLQELTT
ncbi:phosphoribosylamine--glycine ligase [Neorickettsia helminthoeca str. Oregon]|uniref:phosphoribosylamine--glycine ligase n=1 Tax=Neorickettsia helminthoeca str. Oregon TaxID=1286528 RepID=X5HMS9_9RICK|nr:phosphoribosylamine--glycine ligase [Neorickettsia helminthoeca]AHX11800.1 phosphoribosylamine--glycine ligase [Neorickettsia helminthoeca str. Oregon]